MDAHPLLGGAGSILMSSYSTSPCRGSTASKGRAISGARTGRRRTAVRIRVYVGSDTDPSLRSQTSLLSRTPASARTRVPYGAFLALSRLRRSGASRLVASHCPLRTYGGLFEGGIFLFSTGASSRDSFIGTCSAGAGCCDGRPLVFCEEV
jgi:hypothetical protein